MTKIRVGCINYEIVFLDGLVDDDGAAIYGQAAYDACEIRINSMLESQARVSTLWHEILHTILVNAGYTGDHDEQLISAIANGVHQVIIDNSELIGTGYANDSP